MNVNEIMSSLAEYMRLADETAAIIDGLKDQLKAAMQAAGTDTIIGTEHKASYKTVVSSRIDTAALKKAEPETAARYTKNHGNKKIHFCLIWGGKNMLSLSFQARIFTNYHSGQDCTNGRKYRYSIQYNPLALVHTWVIRQPMRGGSWEWVHPLAMNLQFTPRNSTDYPGR